MGRGMVSRTDLVSRSIIVVRSNCGTRVCRIDRRRAGSIDRPRAHIIGRWSLTWSCVGHDFIPVRHYRLVCLQLLDAALQVLDILDACLEDG